jgi:hypothetical protein
MENMKPFACVSCVCEVSQEGVIGVEMARASMTKKVTLDDQ